MPRPTQHPWDSLCAGQAEGSGSSSTLRVTGDAATAATPSLQHRCTLAQNGSSRLPSPGSQAPLALYLNSTNRITVIPATTPTKMRAFSRAPPNFLPEESEPCVTPCSRHRSQAQ